MTATSMLLKSATNMPVSSSTALPPRSLPRSLHFKPQHFQPRLARGLVVVTRAQDAGQQKESEDDFEARLAALKLAKGQTPMGQGKKKDAVAKAARKEVDYSDEKLHLELAPSYANLALNVALGATLVWIPLTIACVAQTAFVKYRFTDKRISVISTAPWKQEQLDASYSEVKNVVAIGRGVGAWGDIVVELRNNSKIEMRAVPQWQEVRDYIIERAKAMRQDDSAPNSSGTGSKGVSRSEAKGFA